MYKIYFGNNYLQIAGKGTDILSKSCTLLPQEQLEKAVDMMKQGYQGSICVVALEDSAVLLDKALSGFDVVEAAGGLVYNALDQLLCIKRRGLWDLPKGKIEAGESKETAAVREVSEECGIPEDRLLRGALIHTTYHTYTIGSQWIVKPTYWYAMNCEGIPKLAPQAEEAIELAEWTDSALLPARMLETYPSLAEVLQIALFER